MVTVRVWKWVVTTNPESRERGNSKQHFAYNAPDSWHTLCGRYLSLAEPMADLRDVQEFGAGVDVPMCRICVRKVARGL